MELEALRSEKHNFSNTLDEIAKYIFTSKYARYNKQLKRRETWNEAVSRVEDMHLRKFSHLDQKHIDKINWAFDKVRDKKALPSMRSMQFGGEAVEAHEIRLYNCSVRHIDSLRSFSESFYLLLCGTGVGFGLSEKFLNRLPDLVSANDKTGTVMTYVVEDSIEGWADSIEALLNCYFKNTPYSGRKIVFDYSKIRPAGAEIKTGGGKAPGYEGLKASHNKVKALLDDIIEDKKQTRLLSINAYDILMHISDAVLSGGIRRSACSVMFDKDDYRMLNAKTGNWFEENPQRARSNNSVVLIRDQITKEEFESIALRTKEWGEPGYVFADNEDTLFNPCFTADQKILTADGWRTFGELMLSSDDTFIHQDTRIVGKIVDGEEVWELTGAKPGNTVLTKATKIAKTGSNQLVYKMQMASGREVRATGNHHFATKTGMVELRDLNADDKVMIGVPQAFSADKNSVEFKKGWLAGICAGDGNFGKGSSANIDVWAPESGDLDFIEGMASDVIAVSELELNARGGQAVLTKPKFRETTVPNRFRLSSAALMKIFKDIGFSQKGDNYEWLHSCTKDFKSGFISGLFYADGHFEGNATSKTVAGRITQSNKPMLQTIQLIFQELGVLTRIYKLLDEHMAILPDGNGGTAEYAVKESFRLSFSGLDMLNRFKAFAMPGTRKAARLEQFIELVYGTDEPNGKAQYYDKVESIAIDGIEDVYCLEENVNRTLIVEGLTARRCFEIAFLPVTDDGRCGVQMCNLSTVNGAKIENKEDFYEAVTAATIIGTLQASYTNFKYLNNTARELTEEEALLGVSITGLLQKPDILLDPIVQQTAAAIAVEVNKEWANIIGIKQAARVTCIKPEGSSSLAVGSMFSGIHAAHDKVMWRRVQANKLDNVYRHFQTHNPHLCEESKYSANNTDDVISFPIMLPENSLTKGDLTALKHLEIIKSTQKNWVIPGSTSANHKPINHNVSSTVIVKDDEWQDVFDYIFDNKHYFTAVSLLAATGDKDYPQAPNEAVVTPDEIALFRDQMYNFIPVDYSWMNEETDNTNMMAEAVCAGPVGCEVR